MDKLEVKKHLISQHDEVLYIVTLTSPGFPPSFMLQSAEDIKIFAALSTIATELRQLPQLKKVMVFLNYVRIVKGDEIAWEELLPIIDSTFKNTLELPADQEIPMTTSRWRTTFPLIPNNIIPMEGGSPYEPQFGSAMNAGNINLPFPTYPDGRRVTYNKEIPPKTYAAKTERKVVISGKTYLLGKNETEEELNTILADVARIYKLLGINPDASSSPEPPPPEKK